MTCTPTRRLMHGALLTGSLLLAACGGSESSGGGGGEASGVDLAWVAISVGSKEFTEQRILGQIAV